MTEVTRRERIRAATELEIRQHARTLLVQQGRDAVTLRAIARELGITAPALYRYYDSREDLLRQLCDDVCADLASDLNRQLEEVGADDYMAKVFVVCRGFRGWALAHPQEFTLVFATPAEETGGPDRPKGDQFASVFLRIVAPLMSEVPADSQTRAVPFELEPDLARNHELLASAFSTEGLDVPPEVLGPEVVYFLLKWWVRIYGHVALEVFGRFPFALSGADRIFESLLNELAHDIGRGIREQGSQPAE